MHLNEKLRDTIVDQAMEIAGLRSRLDNSEYWRRRNIEMNEIEICEYRRRELYGEDEC